VSSIQVVVVCMPALTRPAYTMHDEDMERQLSQADLLRQVRLTLSETDTMWLLDMPSICVMNESDEALEIIQRNSRYEEVTHFVFRVSSKILCDTFSRSCCNGHKSRAADAWHVQQPHDVRL